MKSSRESRDPFRREIRDEDKYDDDEIAVDEVGAAEHLRCS